MADTASLYLPYTYHAYVYGTAFWYALRALMRIVDPITVISWFRPPIDAGIPANDLEIYTTRTDAYGLLTLAALLIALSDAVPLPNSLAGSSFVAPVSDRAKKPYGRVIVLLTMVHHVLTAMGAYQHWIKPTHWTVAMEIGVFANAGLVMLGTAVLAWGLRTMRSCRGRRGRRNEAWG